MPHRVPFEMYLYIQIKNSFIPILYDLVQLNYQSEPSLAYSEMIIYSDNFMFVFQPHLVLSKIMY